MGRRGLVLIVALLLAGLAAYAIWQVLSDAEAEAAAGIELVDVYRAVEFIPEGSEGALMADTRANRITLSQENALFLPTNSITTQDDLDAFLTGRVAAGPISANQVITTDQWVEITLDIEPLADKIASGKQAMTISAPAQFGVNDFIKPGDLINVLVTEELVFASEPAFDVFSDIQPEAPTDTTPTDGTTDPVDPNADLFAEIQKTYTRTVLQGLEVLAVGIEVREAEGGAPVVDANTGGDGIADTTAPDETRSLITVEVSADQAERLAFAYETGRVWLTLHPTDDFTPVSTEGVTIDNLYPDFGVLSDLFPGLQRLEDFLKGR